MSEAQIQEYIDTYTYFRDKNEIVEEIIKPDSIEIKLKEGNQITLPKHVEVHRFIIIGRRGPVAESNRTHERESAKNTINTNKLSLT